MKRKGSVGRVGTQMGDDFYGRAATFVRNDNALDMAIHLKRFEDTRMSQEAQAAEV